MKHKLDNGTTPRYGQEVKITLKDGVQVVGLAGDSGVYPRVNGSYQGKVWGTGKVINYSDIECWEEVS